MNTYRVRVDLYDAVSATACVYSTSFYLNVTADSAQDAIEKARKMVDSATIAEFTIE